MKAKEEKDLLIQGDQQFRYVTLTKNNQIVIAVLDSNKELKHRFLWKKFEEVSTCWCLLTLNLRCFFLLHIK